MRLPGAVRLSLCPHLPTANRIDVIGSHSRLMLHAKSGNELGHIPSHTENPPIIVF